MSRFIPVEPEKWAAMVKAQSELPRWKEMCDELDARCNKLKAEVERLRKAGDEMEKVIILAECIAGVEHTEKSAIAWNSAKEGKQP